MADGQLNVSRDVKQKISTIKTISIKLKECARIVGFIRYPEVFGGKDLWNGFKF